MKHLLARLLVPVALVVFCVSRAAAQSGAFTYQGRVTVDGEDFTGTGRFKFALVTSIATESQATATAVVNSGFVTSYKVTSGGSGYTNAPKVTIIDASGNGATATSVIATNGMVVSIVAGNPGAGYSANPTVVIDPPGGAESLVSYWSNDGSSLSGSEPLMFVSLPVSGGLFSVVLGDPAALPMQGIDKGVFAVSGLRLRIWFSDGVHGFARLDPSPTITPAPYASRARSVAWTNIVDVPGSFTNAVYAAGGGLAVSNNTVVIVTNGITADLLATNAVTSFAIANGTIAQEDLGSVVLNGTFWSLTGNPAVTDTNSPAYTNTFIGTTDNHALDFKVNGQRALRLEPGNGGAPNVVGGFVGNSAGANRVGVVIGGGGSASSGFTNRVEGDFGTLGGGFSNSILTNSLAATVSGGGGNRIGNESEYATVAGGRANNIAAGSPYVVLGGGQDNVVATNSSHAVLSGGQANTILTNSGSSTISGGRANMVLNSSPYSAIGGGFMNTNSGIAAAVPGGTLNAALGANSFAAGRRAKAVHPGSFVWGDGYDDNVSSTSSNQMTIRATGGVRIFSNGGLSSGVALAPGQSAWTVPSDAALKKNRATVDGRETLEKLAAIPIDHWNYVWEDDGTTPHIGPMAQDFKHAFYPGTDDKSISTLDFDGVALSAIQGLNQKLEDKDAELKALRQEVEELRKLVREVLPAK